MAQDEGDWVPFSVREGMRDSIEFETLHEGVPDWLRSSLWEWLRSRIVVHSMYVLENAARELERKLRFDLGWDGIDEMDGLRLVQSHLEEDESLLLDAIDLQLSKLGAEEQDIADTLDQRLREGGSALKVARRDATHQLERRVPEPVERAAETVMSQAGRAGELLSEAWTAVYGRHPRPSDGYRQAVRAVEAATIPVVLPDDKDATLGKVVGTLRADPDHWHLVLAHRKGTELSTLTAMLDLLWGSQHDRHVPPDDDAPLHVSAGEAEAAVHLAVTLVHWFSTGAVRRR